MILLLKENTSTAAVTDARGRRSLARWEVPVDPVPGVRDVTGRAQEFPTRGLPIAEFYINEIRQHDSYVV